MNKKPLGIVILGSALVVTYSFMFAEFVSPGGYEAYSAVFRPMPQGLILLRYCFSIILRIAGVACGIGIILRKEMFRRLAVGLGVFNIVTIFLKHPQDHVGKMMAGFSRASSEVSGLAAVGQPWAVRQEALFAVASLYFIDIVFAACIVVYLSAPQTRAWFQKGVLPDEHAGVVASGLLLGTISFLYFEKLLNPEYYAWLFEPLSREAVAVRYAISVLVRVLGFVAGFGVLLRREFFRKLLVVACGLAVATCYLRHPWWAFVRHEKVVFGVIAKLTGTPEITQPPLFTVGAVIGFVLLYLLELVFPAMLVFYFTRRGVARWFAAGRTRGADNGHGK